MDGVIIKTVQLATDGTKIPVLVFLLVMVLRVVLVRNVEKGHVHPIVQQTDVRFAKRMVAA